MVFQRLVMKIVKRIGMRVMTIEMWLVWTQGVFVKLLLLQTGLDY